jgi:UPF0755 protein
VKRKLLVIALIVLLPAIFLYWKIFTPSVRQPEGKYLFIKTGTSFEGMTDELVSKKILGSAGWFNRLAGLMKFENVKTGRYEIKDNMSLFQLVRMLKNGQQAPVKLTIIKFRLKEDIAKKLGGMFEFDSLSVIQFLNNNDSLRHFGLDSNTAMAAILPDTYEFFWNTTPGKVYRKLYDEWKKFWTEERKEKAKQSGLSEIDATILASIIDEETNQLAEKRNISSVYLNRMNINMPLQSCPTVKYALKDFALKRIYEKHIAVQSPYNTYHHTGLPPGPICTPQPETIDLVLNAPKTDYLYFVAKSDFSDAHEYSASYADHLKKAREYQKALNRQDSIRKAKK